MYESKSDNITEEIQQKIKLFTKEKYFDIFSNMLTKQSKNLSAFKKVSSLVLSIDNYEIKKEQKKNKNFNIKKIEEKKYNNSPWFYFMINICNVSNKKKFIKQRKNELNINPIIYSYMTNFCKNKIKQLNLFSIQHHLNFKNLVKFYLELCSNQIILEKENINKSENFDKNIFEINNNKISYNRYKLKSKINIKEIRNNNFSTDLRNKINYKSQKIHQIITPQKPTKPRVSIIFQKKSKKDGKQIDYRNSFARLFIGETDQKSVRERYLSNIFLKNLHQLNLFNKNEDLSTLYLKKFYNKFKNESGTDNITNTLLHKFKIDTKMIENYQKNALSFDKKDEEKKFIKRISVYKKPIIENSKFSQIKKRSKYSIELPRNFSEEKILMKFRNNRDKLNIKIRGHKSKSVLFNLSSSDYNQGLTPKYSRNGSDNFSGLRMVMSNDSNIKTTINSKMSKYKIKIKVNYSPSSHLNINSKRNSINKNSDSFLKIKTKLTKENEKNITDNKKFLIKTFLSNDFFYNKFY